LESNKVMGNTRLTPDIDLPFDWRLDFTDIQTGKIRPWMDCSIASVTNVDGAPATTILINGGAYSFGDPIVNGDEIDVTVTIASVIDLNFDF